MLIVDDIKYYIKKQGFITAFFNLGLWSLILYRTGALMYNKNLFKVFLVWYFYLILKNILLLISKIELPPSAKIGSRLNLVHAYGLVMGDKVVIGDEVTIGPWVVIGHNGIPTKQPIIGNKVYVGAHACILGGIVIEEHCLIGANSVVTKNMEKNSTSKVDTIIYKKAV
jgi:serine O-acetyltransferase